MPIIRRWNTMAFVRENIRRISTAPGVYVLLARNNYPIYVGSAENLRTRLLQHQRSGDIPASKFRAIQTLTMQDAIDVELDLIQELEPRYNMLGR